MAVVTEHGTAGGAGAAAAVPKAARRRGLLFWIKRYLPAEIAGTAVLLVCGIAVSQWLGAPAATAVAAVMGESLGFYGVLAVLVYVEQSTAGRSRRRALVRTALLLIAEFGAAELLDTLLVRPAALLVGVLLIPDPMWGLLAGKVAADVIFYAVAAGAFTVTAKTGLRESRREVRP